MAKPPGSSETKPFTVVLPTKAAENLEILLKTGNYGSTRAEAAKIIILQHLQKLWESGKLPD